MSQSVSNAAAGAPPPLRGLNDEFLRLALRAAGMGIWLHDIPSGAVYWSPELEAIFGIPTASFENTVDDYVRRIHPDDRAAVRERIQTCIRNKGGEFVNEHRILLPDGSIRWTESRGELVLDDRQNPIRMLGTTIDVTNRKRADAALHGVIADTALTGPVLFQALVRTLAEQLNARIAFVGMLAENAPGKVRVQAIWADGKPGQTFEYALAGTPCENVVTKGICDHPGDVQTQFPRDRMLVDMGIHSYLGTPLIGASGKPLGLLAVLHDRPLEASLQPAVLLKIVADRVTAELERIRAETAAHQSNALFRTLVASTPHVGIQTYDLEGRVLSWNAASTRLFGFSAAEAVGRTMEDLIQTPEEAADFRDLLRTIARTGEPAGPNEYLVRRKDGTPAWCLSTTFAIHADGSTPVFACMDVDITERKLAEQALRESELRYRTLVESAPEAQVILDFDQSRFIEVNSMAERLFGLSHDELIRVGPAEMSPEFQPDGRSSAEAARQVILQALAGEQVTFPWTHRNRAGENIPCEIRLVRLPASDQRLLRGSISDITERLRMEDELRQSQKLESIGRLAGGIAHDFNNLLTSIIGYNELARQQVTDPAIRHQLEVVGMAAQRGAELTAQLLAFARRQVISPRNVSLNATLADAELLLRRVIGEPVELTTIPHPAMPLAHVDPGQLTQIVLNLAINARDAMPRGGRLTLETGFATLDEAYVENAPDVTPGRYVVLTVSDTGHGISAEHQRRIFEPFFTTKNPSQGTGLGLATCYGIVKQHNGHMTVYSEPGKGTTFKVYLPPADRNWPDDPPPSLPAGTVGEETILVCEDDPMLCDLTREILAGAGYQVFAAVSAVELLRHAAATTATVHLLITDLVMPDLSGPELAARMKQLRPDLRVLFVSGYTENTALQSGQLEKGFHFLQKPFSLADLTRTVREVLDGKE